MIKTLKLDYNTWRCGSYADDITVTAGHGRTSLLNKEGYMCCLGQFGEQFGLGRNDLLDKPMPDSERTCAAYKQHGLDSTSLQRLQFINDSRETTLSVKIQRIKNVLEEAGIELEVVNFPR